MEYVDSVWNTKHVQIEVVEAHCADAQMDVEIVSDVTAIAAVHEKNPVMHVVDDMIEFVEPILTLKLTFVQLKWMWPQQLQVNQQ